MSDLSLTNLALAISRFVSVPDSIIRGGDVVPTAPASLAVVLKPTVAMSPAEKLLVLDANTNLNVAGTPPSAPHPALPRFDLVSIGYQEAETNEELRKFRDPDSGVKADVLIATKIQSQPLPLVTQGVPAASPAVPATPAGHIPLAVVVVNAAAATITANDILTVYDKRAYPMQVVTAPFVAAPPALPNNAVTVTGTLASLATPANRFSIVFVSLMFTADAQGVPGWIKVEIEDAASGARYGQAALSYRNDALAAETGYRSVALFAAIPGPSVGLRHYRLRFVVTDVNGAALVNLGNGWGSMFVLTL
jgi:hypothetical protein